MSAALVAFPPRGLLFVLALSSTLHRTEFVRAHCGELAALAAWGNATERAAATWRACMLMTIVVEAGA